MIRKVLLAAAFSIALFGARTASAECLPEDMQSRNAEKCAKAYAKALLVCVKNGTALQDCDTSKSSRYCSLLSPTCQPQLDVDAGLAAVYGNSPLYDACKQNLARESLRLVVARFLRARRGEEMQISRDVGRCFSKGAMKCTSAPSLPSPCGSSTSAEDAAQCVCRQPGCSDIAPETFEFASPWGATAIHAQTLGFTEIESARICTAVTGETSVLEVSMRNPAGTAPTDRVSLRYSETEGSTFLIRAEPDGGVTFFNESGGFHQPAIDGASAEPTDETGTVVDAASPLVVPRSLTVQECPSFSAYLICQGLGQTSNAGCGRSIISALRTCKGNLACIGTLVGAACIEVLRDWLEEQLGLGADCIDPKGKPCGNCTTGSTCNEWGTCEGGTAVEPGLPCTDTRNFPNSPMCVEFPGANPVAYNTACRNGVCQADSVGCSEGQECKVDSFAYCQTTTTTTTTSSTTTTQPNPCSMVQCGPAEVCNMSTGQCAPAPQHTQPPEGCSLRNYASFCGDNTPDYCWTEGAYLRTLESWTSVLLSSCTYTIEDWHQQCVGCGEQICGQPIPQWNQSGECHFRWDFSCPCP